MSQTLLEKKVEATQLPDTDKTAVIYLRVSSGFPGNVCRV